MKHLPLPFSDEMILSLDRKTMTRRLVNPQPNENGISFMKNAPLDWEAIYKEEWKPWKLETEEGESIALHCPYGQPGDVLWIRESWEIQGWDWDDGQIKIGYADGVSHWKPMFYTEEDKWMIKKISQLEDAGIIIQDPKGNYIYTDKKNKRFLPRFMPKVFCRHFLMVDEIRVERLQDISTEDAIAEGVEWWIEERMRSKPKHYRIYSDFDNPKDPALYTSCPKDSFRSLIQHIHNGPEVWNRNDWVWVVKFHKCEQPKDFITK
jgi:hypothetical protein